LVHSYSFTSPLYYTFIDLVTFKPLELVLPVTVLFVALLGLANALVWPAMWPLALPGWGDHKNSSAMLIMAIAGGAYTSCLWQTVELYSTQTVTGYVSHLIL